MLNSFKKHSLPFLIIISCLFMSIGYASINGKILEIDGNVTSVVDKKLIITNIDVSNEEKVIVNSYDDTLINCNITLSDNNVNSSEYIEVTLYNNYENKSVYFNDIKYMLGKITYDNENIVFEINGIKNNYELLPKKSITFKIIFKYADEYILKNPIMLDNNLNCILNIYFGNSIVFDANGGIISLNENYFLEANDDLKELFGNIPTKTNHIFMGWYDNSDYTKGQMFYDNNNVAQNIDELSISSSVIKLYAGWKEKTYTYQYVEYIESNGDVYIMTNIGPTDNLKIDFEWYTQGTGENYILGSSAGDNSNILLGQYGNQSNSISAIFNRTILNARTNSDLWQRTTDGKWYHTIISTNNGTGYYEIENIDDKMTYSGSTSYNLIGEIVTPISIFGYNSLCVTNTKSRIKTINIYKYSTGELLYVLQPVIRSDNEIGLYDTINNKFYKKSGTGNLTAGPII